MTISKEEGQAILDLLEFTENEGQARPDQFALAIRVAEHFGILPACFKDVGALKAAQEYSVRWVAERKERYGL